MMIMYIHRGSLNAVLHQFIIDRIYYLDFLLFLL